MDKSPDRLEYSKISNSTRVSKDFPNTPQK